MLHENITIFQQSLFPTPLLRIAWKCFVSSREKARTEQKRESPSKNEKERSLSSFLQALTWRISSLKAAKNLKIPFSLHILSLLWQECVPWLLWLVSVPFHFSFAFIHHSRCIRRDLFYLWHFRRGFQLNFHNIALCHVVLVSGWCCWDLNVRKHMWIVDCSIMIMIPYCTVGVNTFYPCFKSYNNSKHNFIIN